MVFVFPGFEVLHPNHIYNRDLKAIINDKTILVSNIVMLSRFKTPQFNDLMNYSSRHAQNALSGFKKNSDHQPVMHGYIDDLLCKTPVDVLKSIADLSESFVNYAKSTLSPEYLSTVPKESVVLKYGIISAENIRWDVRNIHNPEWFQLVLEDDTLTSEGIGTQFKVFITLRNNQLPNYKLVNLLIHQHVPSSDLLDICGIYDSTLIKYYVRLLYMGASKAPLGNIRDTSHRVLDNVAVQLAVPYLQQVAPYMIPKYPLPEANDAATISATIN